MEGERASKNKGQAIEVLHDHFSNLGEGIVGQDRRPSTRSLINSQSGEKVQMARGASVGKFFTKIRNFYEKKGNKGQMEKQSFKENTKDYH